MATISTSPRFCESSFKETLMVVLSPTTISWVTYPIKEMFNTDFLLGATIVKLPSKSVIVPMLVPFTVTLAPGTPSLSVSSVTLPLIVIPSGGKAYIIGMNKRNVTRKQNLKLSAFLILFNLIG